MKKLATNRHGIRAVQHSKPTPVLVLGLAGLISLAAAPGNSFAADPAYAFKVVTTIGDPAPGGGTFTNDFEPSALNNRGQLAFTADARLFAQPHDAASKKYQMKIFDRSTSSWQSTNAVGIPPARAYLVGADGTKLAFESRSDSVQIFWVPLTSEH